MDADITTSTPNSSISEGITITVMKTEMDESTLELEVEEAEVVHRTNSDSELISMVMVPNNKTDTSDDEENFDDNTNNDVSNVTADESIKIKTEVETVTDQKSDEETSTKKKQKRKMSNWCSAINCRNERYRCPKLSFHRFPKDEARCKKWVINCRRQDLLKKSAQALYRGNVLCSEHFEPSQFVGVGTKKTRLKPFKAIPTLFDININVPAPCDNSDKTDKTDKTKNRRTRSRRKPKYEVVTKKADTTYPAWCPELKLPPTVPDVSKPVSSEQGHSSVCFGSEEETETHEETDVKEETREENQLGTRSDDQQAKFLDSLTFSLIDFQKLKVEYIKMSHEVNKLRKKTEELKSAARINLDLLALTLDVSIHDQSKDELDKVVKLVKLIMNDRDGDNGGGDDEVADDVDVCDEQQTVKSTKQSTKQMKKKKSFEDSQTWVMAKNRKQLPSTPKKVTLLTDPGAKILADVDADVEDETESKDSVNSEPKGNTLFGCNFCDKKFVCKRSVARHQLIHRRMEKKFHCYDCDKWFWSKWNLRNHCKALHSGSRGGVCDKCGSVFKSNSGLSSHLKYKCSKSFSCSECDNVFLYASALETHMAEFHPDVEQKFATNESEGPGYICDKCGSIFSRQDTLKRHRCKKLSKCTECDKMFLYMKNLDKHMEQAHPSVRPHKCSLCPKEYQTQHRLNGHMQSRHSDANRFVNCHLCNRSCHLHNIPRHMKLHKGKYPHRCQFCCRGFSEMDECESHMEACKRKDLPPLVPWSRKRSNDGGVKHKKKRARRIVGKRMFKCYKCEEEYIRWPWLEEHIDKVHQEEIKSYICSKCNKAFYVAEHLEEHQKKDHALKICNVCGKGVATLSSLLRHKKLHLGEKRFSCNVCGKSFAQKTHRDTHAWTHREDKRFYCHHCGRGFNDKRNFSSHGTRCLGINNSTVNVMGSVRRVNLQEL